ncbi:hypothetical protein HanIR_Chr08g0371051 [Helianthus annuus]|nr:hypothetical protein HanIR_Chr08g0371051 [Helianthus annuus]
MPELIFWTKSVWSLTALHYAITFILCDFSRIRSCCHSRILYICFNCCNMIIYMVKLEVYSIGFGC